MRRRPEPSVISVDGSSIEVPWYESLRPEFSGGHLVELLESGAEFFPAVIDAIDESRQAIFVETYMFVDDRSGRSVASALVRAAQRGVDVRCVADGFGTPELRGEVARMLESPGIRFETFRPERFKWSFDRQRLRRLHRKLIVVDGQDVFVGGINLVDDWSDPNHGKLDAPRFDFAVRVRGPLVASAHLAASRLWWELALVNRSLRKPRPSGNAQSKAANLGPPDAVRSVVAPSGEMRAALFVRDNFRYRRTIERWYLHAIGRAHKDVLIANAYFLPGVRFRRALIRAVKRGVRVRLLLQGKVEYPMQHFATQALYDRLLSQGVEIIEYESSFLHAKVAVIDDLATVGSSNIDPFSLLLAREANVVVDDKTFAAQLRQRLEIAIAKGGRPLELKTHRQRPWPVRAMNWVSFALLRLAVSLTGQAGRY